MSFKQKKKNPISTSGFVSFDDVVNLSSNHQSVQLQHYNQEALNSVSSNTIKVSPIYSGSHPELSVSCKKLLKKDITTKLKALTEINTILLGCKKEDNILSEFLPFFSFAFSKLVIETNWQIREKFGVVLKTIVQLDKQSLGPFMKECIGPWWQVINDTSIDVSSCFLQSFQEAIPVKRRPMVITHLSTSILRYIQKFLLMNFEEFKIFLQYPDEDSEEKYERLIISNITGLTRLIQELNDEQNEKLYSGVNSTKDIVNGTSDISYCDVINASILSKHLTTKNNNIRKASYILVRQASEKIPKIFSEMQDNLTQFIVSGLNDSSKIVFSESFHTIISVAKSNGHFWDKPSVISKVFNSLKSNKKNFPEILSDFLLPMIGTIPISKAGIFLPLNFVTEDSNDKSFKLVQLFFQDYVSTFSDFELIENFKSNSYLSILNSTLDCLVFILLRKPSEAENEFVQNIERIKMILDLFIISVQSSINYLFASYSSSTKFSSSQESLLATLSNSLGLIHRSTIQNSLPLDLINTNFWVPFQDLVYNQFIQSLTKNNFVETNSNCFSRSFLSFMKIVIDKIPNNFINKQEILNEQNFQGIFLYPIKIIEYATKSLLEYENKNQFEPYIILHFLQVYLDLLSLHYFRPKVISDIHTLFISPLANIRFLFTLIQEIKNPKKTVFSKYCLKYFHKFIESLSIIESFDDLLSQDILETLVQLIFQYDSVDCLLVLLLSSQGKRLNKLVQFLPPIKIISLSLLGSLPNGQFSQKEIDSTKGILSILQQSDLSIKILFLRSISLLFEEFSVDMMNLAFELWKSSQSNIVIWYLLTMTKLALEQSNNSSLPSHIQILSSSTWLEKNSEFKFISKLILQFFTRDRNLSYSQRDKFELFDWIISPGTLICSWKDLELYLLPVLPENSWDQFTTSLADQLNFLLDSFLLTDKTNESSKNIELETNDLPKESFQPSKWARHISHLLQITQKYPQKTNVSAFSIRLFQTNFWNSIKIKLIDYFQQFSSSSQQGVSDFYFLSKLSFILSSLIELFGHSHSHSSDITRISSKPSLDMEEDDDLETLSSIWHQDISLFYNLRLTLHLLELISKNFSSDQISLLINLIYEILDKLKRLLFHWPLVHKELFLINLLEYIKNNDLRNYVNRSTIVLIENFQLELFQQVVCVLFPHLNSLIKEQKMLMPYPSVSNMKALNNLHYISIEEISVDLSTSDLDQIVKKIYSLVPVKVLAFHLDNGVDHPFYTIEINKRELQTDWSRLIGIEKSFSQESKDEVIFTSLISLFPSCDTKNTFFWFLLNFNEFIKTYENTGASPEFAYRANLLLTVLESLLSRSIDDCQSQTQTLVNYLRGWVIEKTQKSRILSQKSEFFLFSIKIFSLLVNSSIGLGSGLWLSQVLSNLQQFSIEFIKYSGTENQFKPDSIHFQALCIAIGNILKIMEFNSAEWLFESVLIVNILPRITKASTLSNNLQSSFLFALQFYWMRESSKRSESVTLLTNSSSTDIKIPSWELETFSFVISKFILSLNENADCNISETWSILEAVQFGLLNRTKSAIENLIDTSNLINFKNNLFSFIYTKKDQTSISSNLLLSTKRLIACKLLSIITHNSTDLREKHVNIDIINKELETKLSLTVNDCNSDEEINEKVMLEQNNLEIKQDELIFRSIIGNNLFDSFLDRFSILNINNQRVDQFYLQSTSTKDIENLSKESSNDEYEKNSDVKDISDHSPDFEQVLLIDNESTEEKEEKEEDDIEIEHLFEQEISLILSLYQHSNDPLEAMKSENSSSELSSNLDLKEYDLIHSRSVRNSIKKHTKYQTIIENDWSGSIFTWILILDAIDAMSIKDSATKISCSNFLKNTEIYYEVFFSLLTFIAHYQTHILKQTSKSRVSQKDNQHIFNAFQRLPFLFLFEFNSLSSPLSLQVQHAYNSIASSLPSRFGTLDSSNSPISDDPIHGLYNLSLYALYRTVMIFPSLFRAYYTQNTHLNRIEKQFISRLLEEKLSSNIIRHEITLINEINASETMWKLSEFQVRGNPLTGEILLSLLRDEVNIELMISISKSFPLKNIEIKVLNSNNTSSSSNSSNNSSGNQLLSDQKWSKWLLQMIQLVNLQDNHLLNIITLWKNNIEHELQDIEPCPICYCVLHTKTLKIPSFSCPTCHNKFHSICLQTWFKSSGKSKCVLCQQPIYRS